MLQFQKIIIKKTYIKLPQRLLQKCKRIHFKRYEILTTGIIRVYLVEGVNFWKIEKIFLEQDLRI